jgi:hypothetical protein
MVADTGTSVNETIQGFLAPQNEARKQVGVPPLKWDVKLTAYVTLRKKEGATAYSSIQKAPSKKTYSRGVADVGTL